MEQSGVQISGEHGEPPDGVEEDRLSALPDDMLVLILQCLDTTAEAARTSVLARRWRSLWPLLTKLRFELRPDGSRIRELLDVPDAPVLRHISVTTNGAAADSATAWLPVAARRLAGGLFYRNMHPDWEEEDRWGGNVHLPCFENATSIELHLGRLGLAFPPLGVFARLTEMSLREVEFHDPCGLGDLVSWPRCPCLQKLSIYSCFGLHNLSIHSESLLQIELQFCSVWHLTVVAPILQELCMKCNFIAHPGEPVVNITAPQVVSLVWIDLYDPRNFHLGNLGQVRELRIPLLYVYGLQSHRSENHLFLSLLHRFQVLYSLHVKLIYGLLMYQQNIHGYSYLLEDIIVLPKISFLQLDLHNTGHAFGASLFHLLRMCIGLTRLSLVLYARSNLEVQRACPSGCICDHPENWKADELVLGHLEDVQITGLQGAKHEVAFVQRLLCWATVLKSLRITFDNKMTEDKIMEFHEALAGFFRPETCVQFDMSDSK